MSAEAPETGLYRRLVRFLLPHEFREQHEEGLVWVFSDLLAEARTRSGPRGRVMIWVREVRALFQLSWSVRRRGEPPRGLGRGGTGLLHDLSGDVRYAIRGLAKSPQFAAIAVVILGLGIGANTAVFSVVDAVYFDDAPNVAAPDDLVRLYRTSTSWGRSLSVPDFEYYRDNQETLDGLMAYRPGGLALNIGRSELRLDGTGTFVSYNYFDVLGTQPAVGRWFLAEEDQGEGTHLVAVISHGVWSRFFGSRSSVLGQTVELNGNPFTVVGVTPPGFRGPSPLEIPPDV